jgi:hypothetical protein
MNRKVVLLTVALIVALGLLVLALRWTPHEAAVLERDPGIKVVVIGIDGLDWYLLNQFMQEGRTPTLGQIIPRSLLGEIVAPRPVLPEVGWTVLSRGAALTEDEQRLVTAVPRPLRFDGPDIARLVTSAGGTAVTIGWPATWPVPEATADDGSEAPSTERWGSHGIVIAPYAPEAASHAASLSPTLFAEGELQVTPQGFVPIVEAVVRAQESAAAAFSEIILPGPDSELPRWKDNIAAARWALTSDLITLELAARILAEFEPDLALINFSGLDAVSHRFVAPAMPVFFDELTEEEETRYGGVLRNYYTFIDGAVRRLSRIGDDRTVYVVCSTYGMHPSTSGDVLLSGSHERGSPGVLIVQGHRITPVPSPVSVNLEDVVPTVLALLGHPLPSNLDGRIIAEATPPGLLEAFPPQYVSPDDREPVRARVAASGTMEALARRRLESLK